MRKLYDCLCFAYYSCTVWHPPAPPYAPFHIFTTCLLVNPQVREASLPPEHWEESYHRLMQVGVLYFRWCAK